jgi:outer membrane protein assembly factor BamA
VLAGEQSCGTFARVHGETVSGDTDEVPFDELPKLGGAVMLRGYPTDRFRDRAAALGTLEYRWDLAMVLTTSLFVDVGKVAPSVADLGDGDLRVGYGIGFDAYTKRNYIGRIAIATSIDGGWFFNLSFDPTFDIETRTERR